MKLLSATLIFFLFSTLLFGQHTDRYSTDAVAKSEMTHSISRNARVATKSDSIDVFYHNIYWNAAPGNATISGSVQSNFLVKQNAISELYFDMSDALTVDSIVYHGSVINSLRPSDNTIEIALPNPLGAGVTDSITIFYHGIPSAAYFNNDHSGVPEVYTLSEPYGASEWWPCKNSLNDKIDSMDIHITTPIGNRAGSLGLLESIDTVGNNVTYNWAHHYPVTTYLVSIAITNYTEFTEYVHVGVDSFPIVNYVYPEHLNYAQAQVPRIVRMFDLFDSLFMPYPFMAEKYGHAETQLGGGMEHQTMSTMGSFNDDLMAHELAHQWFGDYVTCASWEELWLNEGFATFLTGLTIQEFKLSEDWLNWKRSKISNVTSRPDGSVFVSDTTSFWRLFSSRLTYDKGGMLLHMLRWKLGDEDFFTGVQNYLADQRTSYGYVANSDLISKLEASSGQDLTEFFDDWFYGEGFPTYRVTLAGSRPNYTINISQTTSHSSVDFFEMPVELRFAGVGLDSNIRFENTQNNQWFNVTLDKDISIITVDPHQWLVMGGASVILGNEEIENAKISPRLYPQPVMSELNISNIDMNSNITDLRVFDITGNQIQIPVEGLNSEWKLNTENISSGMYFIVHPDWSNPLKFVK